MDGLLKEIAHKCQTLYFIFLEKLISCNSVWKELMSLMVNFTNSDFTLHNKFTQLHRNYYKLCHLKCTNIALKASSTHDITCLLTATSLKLKIGAIWDSIKAKKQKPDTNVADEIIYSSLKLIHRFVVDWSSVL